MAEKETKEKPLDKMTAKELREVAKEMSEITGAHGMNKGELLAAIKEVRGIADTKKKSSGGQLRDIKKKIQTYKSERAAALEAQDRRMAKIYRRRISRLKKKTRRAS